MAEERMPVLFMGHGSPMNTLETNRWTEAWRALSVELPRPTAVLAVSAHWYVGATAVTAMAHPRTIHDFGGFPDELFRVQYPAPGSPALAERVAELLAPTTVLADLDQWGLDHGTWSVLAHLLPEADVPVVQLSIDAGLAPDEHLELGRRLAPLRDEGVLVLGSGNVVHNLGLLRWKELMGPPPASPSPPFDWARRANESVRGAIERGDDATLTGFLATDDGRLAAPTPDHYLPLLYVEGVRGADDAVSVVVDGYEGGSLSMLSVRIG